MSQVQIATGNADIRGKFLDNKGNLVEILNRYSKSPWIPTEGQKPFFFGVATGGGIKFGGTTRHSETTEEKENFGEFTLASYKAGDGNWAKVVHIPPGIKFTARLIRNGNVNAFAQIEITVHDNETDLKEATYQLCLAALNKEFGK